MPICLTRPHPAGTLVLVGGAERRDDPEGVLARIWSISRARSVCVIPTASEMPTRLGASYSASFRDLGAEEVHVLDIRHRDETARPEYLRLLGETDLVFFTGGDQTRLSGILLDTPVFDLIRSRYREGLTLAGTSAGAAVMSDPLIYDGDDHPYLKGAVMHVPGFGLVEGVIVDTHFTQRDRLPRLMEAMAADWGRHGLGLDENTGAIVHPDGSLEVIGEGCVTVTGRETQFATDYPDVERSREFRVEGVSVERYRSGDRFHLPC